MPYQLRVGPNVTQSTTAIINDATETNDGVMTMAMVKQLKEASGDAAEDDVFIYVNSVSGNDNKDGSTPAKAVMTLAKALSLVPCCWKKHCQLIFAPGTYPITVSQPMYLGEPVGPNADSAAFIGAFTNELGTRTATAGSTGETITDGTLILGVDAYFGAFLSCTTGANAGQRRMISGNTAGGVFSLNSPFFNPVTAGDKFKVEKPSVIFDVTGIWGLSGGGVKIANKGIKWQLHSAGLDPASVDQTFFVNDGQQGFEGCEVTTDSFGNFTVIHGGFANMKSFPPPVGGELDPLNPFSFLRLPAGMYIHEAVVTVLDRASIEGYFCAQNCLFQGFNSCRVIQNDPFTKNVVQLYSGNVSFAVFGSESNGFGTSRGVMDGEPFGGDLLTTDGTSRLFCFDFDVKNATGHGIAITAGCSSALGNVGGTGNGAGGVVLTDLCLCQTNGGGGNTITGPGGDILVGTIPVTWGAFAPTTDPVTLTRLT